LYKLLWNGVKGEHTRLTNTIIAGFKERDEIWSEKVTCASKV